jgi:hypothetical protein
MNPLDMFGKVGHRTKNILKVLIAGVAFAKPLFEGQVPGLSMVNIPVAVDVINWGVTLLSGMGLLTFADKFTPERRG